MIFVSLYYIEQRLYLIYEMENMKYFFANFKMYFSMSDMSKFIKNHKQEIIKLAEQKNIQLSLMPSYEQLYFLQQEFQESNVATGAQSCSTHSVGAHTGQVSVESLFDLQVEYCLVGHNETRTALGETNEQLVNKVKNLFAANITPIFCIGESLDEKEDGYTLQVLFDQLESILQIMPLYKDSTIFIAYEPVYAIGTGVVPDAVDVKQVFAFLKKLTSDAGFAKNVMFLYGGSVTSKSIDSLNQISNIDGYLVGSASRDFQELKKIVLSDNKILKTDQQKRLQMRN